jgi:hypothetical protein
VWRKAVRLMWRSALLLLACTILRAQSSSDAAAIGEFQKRVASYMKIHDQAKSEVGKLKPTPSADRIANHEKQQAHKIREAREHARQGNIFTAEIAAAFRRRIGTVLESGNAATMHQSLRRSEPVVLPLKVNRAYPEGVPLETTPPSLLAKLPELPAELEYRVVGHALVLRDATANLIVDFLPDVIP